jgi:hypothetical protein
VVKVTELFTAGIVILVVDVPEVPGAFTAVVAEEAAAVAEVAALVA